jgi:hypothetical protein
MGYPERNGWRVIYRGKSGATFLYNGERPSDKQLEGFIQNYLYFGLIHEVLGEYTKLSKFITENKLGEPILTTATLESCLVQWGDESRERIASDESEKLKEHAKWNHVYKLLIHAWGIGMCKANIDDVHTFDERIWLSLAVLCETFASLALDVIRDREIFPLPNLWRHTINSYTGMGKLLLNSMRKSGWCPFDIKRIDLTTYSCGTLYYLSQMEPTRESFDHSDCTEETCLGMVIEDTYSPRHTKNKCRSCNDISEVESVIDALRGPGLPLLQQQSKKPGRFSSIIPRQVRKTFRRKGSPCFKVIPSSGSTEFVSISHVWAEGLGNPKGNYLPQCSLGWISQLVNALPKKATTETMPFWIDTLCVPVAPYDMWVTGMNRLRIPYREATHVLVLDSYLYTRDSSTLSNLEIFARVICCSWSRRLWTFQEGRLARSLWFQFADKAVQLEDVCSELWDCGLSEYTVTGPLSSSYRGSEVVKYPGINNYKTIEDMRESLQARTVSDPTDEALCLFCNMGLDMELITNIPPEDRMPMFWSQIKRIPVGMVFSTAPRKLTRKGFRWAPATFMGETASWCFEQRLIPCIDGFSTSNGLQAHLPGILLNRNFLMDDDDFEYFVEGTTVDIQDSDGVWYFIEFRDRWNQDRTKFPKAGDQIAILMSENVGAKEYLETRDNSTTNIFNGVFDFTPSNRIDAAVGVLTETSEDGIRKVEIYQNADVVRLSPAIQAYLKIVDDLVEIFVKKEKELIAKGETAAKEEGAATDEFQAPKDDLVESELQGDKTTTEEGTTVEISQFLKNDDEAEPKDDQITTEEVTGVEEPSNPRSEEWGPTGEQTVTDEVIIVKETPNPKHDELDSAGGNVPVEDRMIEYESQSPTDKKRDDDEIIDPSMWSSEIMTRCADFVSHFVSTDESSRGLCEANAERQEMPLEQVYAIFGADAKKQLEMRIRNRIKFLPQTEVWCVD